ncbi:circadian clock protein KaiB [Nodosilinea sp. LEGE 07088]|uniref:circadian clock KaiB family protein n=1 Tax=Nodosilinea sp. LEGE 07088 TaxID=2777968 RepID=UPI00187DF63E|nr:circadian clock KaiB family protein [Nodosilinea sp. LEGE 07088]MBE9138576.1 circadian clock protein KaiB [Nodosilinea sp. LEGE 07088]
MSNATQVNPVASSFKGIALFTPGGDCVYCIDEQKRAHWHLDLCATLQSHLGLAEPPYFLLPCYTATVDRWINSSTQVAKIVAEAYPRALRFQPLLNALFGLGDLPWQPNYGSAEECSVALIESYRSAFPQLWECHDLIIRVEQVAAKLLDPLPQPKLDAALQLQPYSLKLFVNGIDTAATEKMLRLLHTTLENSLLGAYTLQVIDVITHPAAAEAANISATPTLIQVSPAPQRRLVGNVLNQEQMAQLLESS